MANISLRNITKHYGNNLILDKISLDIKDCEFFCITGSNTHLFDPESREVII